MLWSQSVFCCVVRWPMTVSKPFKACEINAECVSSHYCRALRIREAHTRKWCFPRPFAMAVTKGLCFPSVPLQVVCRTWLVCSQTAVLCVKAGCMRVLDLTCLLIMAMSNRYIDSGCDFSSSALQWAAQSIHCKPASSSCHSSGWCSSSISELAENGDDQMQLVKKTKHMLYGNICSVSLSWRWNFTASRQNSLRGEIVAFWKAYLNIRCAEMTHQLCIKDFATSGNPEVGHSLLSTEVLLVNMLWALQKHS